MSTDGKGRDVRKITRGRDASPEQYQNFVFTWAAFLGGRGVVNRMRCETFTDLKFIPLQLALSSHRWMMGDVLVASIPACFKVGVRLTPESLIPKGPMCSICCFVLKTLCHECQEQAYRTII